MIKVIKHGKFRQWTCRNCGCIFTFERDDAETVQTGINEWQKEIECPDCKERNVVLL